VIRQYARQIGRREAPKSAIGTKAELGEIFSRDCKRLRERAHVVDGTEIDQRALRLEPRERCEEERIVA
jgi:hypothetical protein